MWEEKIFFASALILLLGEDRGRPGDEATALYCCVAGGTGSFASGSVDCWSPLGDIYFLPHPPVLKAYTWESGQAISNAPIN